MNKNILLGVIAVLVVVTVAVFLIRNDADPQATISPSPSISGSLSPSPTSSARPTATPVQGVPIGVSTIRPECQLTGEIVFLGNVFKSNGPAFNYQKVHDAHDLIRWSITPADAVTVGPNMFARLPLPDGAQDITIAFDNGTPKYKSYELTASIDYPYVVNNKVEVLNKKCTGTTKVRIDY